MTNDTQEKLELIKQAILETYPESLDFDNAKKTLLGWLAQFKFPPYPEFSNWGECLETFPDPLEDYTRPKDGLKLRFLLKLFTSNHRYVISVIECFNVDAHGKGILSVHVNIDKTEYKVQKSIEMTYNNSFDNSLRPKQTLFVEPFDINTFLDSLNSAGLAILGNELTGKMSKEELTTIKNTVPQQVTFPETE